jgi:membrane-bound lytic murein transglycosylase D
MFRVILLILLAQSLFCSIEIGDSNEDRNLLLSPTENSVIPQEEEILLYREINEYIDHANRLVRENNFIGSEYFYKRAFYYLDSLRATGESYGDLLDSLNYGLNNHYDNFQYVKDLTNYSDENQAFYYRLDNHSEVEIKPFVIEKNKKIDNYISYYSKRARKSFLKIYERSLPYINDVIKIFQKHGLPKELAYLPFVESSYNPFAHSYAYASGLWQFINSTGKVYGLGKNWWEDDRKNIHKSTEAAAKHLKDLYHRFGDWNLVLASYNAGPGKVWSRIKKHKSRDFWRLWRLPRETRKYVPKFHAIATIINNYQLYGLKDYNRETFVYDSLQLDSCVSLKVIADITDRSYEEIKRLNPQLKQWCLPPYAKNYPIMVPAESKIDARNRLSQIDDSLKFASTTIPYSGEKLGSIADKYKIDESALYDLNKDFSEKSIKLVIPPVKDEWFVKFNKKFLSFYDNEKYFLDCQKKLNYRVKKGDSIWKIAKMFKVDINKLKGWNRISSKNIIKPGQRLVIYL